MQLETCDAHLTTLDSICAARWRSRSSDHRQLLEFQENSILGQWRARHRDPTTANYHRSNPRVRLAKSCEFENWMTQTDSNFRALMIGFECLLQLKRRSIFDSFSVVKRSVYVEGLAVSLDVFKTNEFLPVIFDSNTCLRWIAHFELIGL